MSQGSPPKVASHADHRIGARTFCGRLVAAIGIFVATLLMVMVLRKAPPAQAWVFALFGLTILLPYIAWLAVILRYDHWTSRPWRLMMLAVGWGSLPSFITAVSLENTFDPIGAFFGVPELEIMIVAPFWEEVTKGLFIVLLYGFARQHLRGPWDGVVYGALVGAGFGFTEDVAYMAISDDGFIDVAANYLIREIFTAHAHPMFTAATGLAAGLAARRGLAAGRAFQWILGGFLIAFVLHAIFDSATVLFPYSGLVVLFLLAPIYAVIFVIALRRLRRREDAFLQGMAR